MALTAAARHLGPQLSPLISRTLPSVAPPTTWVARMSFYPPKQRMRCVSGFAFSQPARRHSLPNRVRFTAHRQFASGCSPPRFAATQLPSATGPWLTPTWTLTMLCTRLHGRTRSQPCWRSSQTANSPKSVTFFNRPSTSGSARQVGGMQAAFSPFKLWFSASRVASQAQVIHNSSVLRNF